MGLTARAELGEHVTPVAEDVEPDDAVPNEGVFGVELCESQHETDSTAAVRDHIEHGTEFRCLVVLARCPTVEHIEELRCGVSEYID